MNIPNGDDLPIAESDARYEQELAARGLDEAFVQRFWSNWHVHIPNGEIREISLSSFEQDGYLTWRW